jgi:hypothetical protein
MSVTQNYAMFPPVENVLSVRVTRNSATGMWKINISEIPDSKQSDPRLPEVQRLMSDDLDNPLWMEALCIHEAAHVVFFAKAGAGTPRIVGPKICYDEQPDRFIPLLATVEYDEPDTEVEMKLNDDGMLLIMRARGCAAGGVAAREMTGMSRVGDAKDFENVRKYCEDISAEYPANVPLDPAAIWENAQAEVSERLTPVVRETIQKTAAIIRTTLYRDYYKEV